MDRSAKERPAGLTKAAHRTLESDQAIPSVHLRRSTPERFRSQMAEIFKGRSENELRDQRL
jgi:hypothetical protein